MKDVIITHAYQTFTIGVADPETADLLEIGLGEPTADCQLTVVDDRDVAIYVADIHYLKYCFVLRNDLLKGGGGVHDSGATTKKLRIAVADSAGEVPPYSADRTAP
jgi:GntR family transcriptional regulator